MDLFERNSKRWKDVYVLGEKMPINRGMAFGKQLAEGMEKNELSGDPILDLLMERIPKFEIIDKVIEDKERGVEVRIDDKRYVLPFLKDGKKKIPILAKPDTINKETTKFKEYKTGQESWTKKKADESGQITFYATAIFLKTKKIPQEIELVYIPTEKNIEGIPTSKIGATGEMKVIRTQRTISQILNMMVRMKRAWRGISELCEKELL